MDFEVEDLENRLEMVCIDLGGGWEFCIGE